MAEKLERVQPPVFPVGNINIPEVSSGLLQNNIPVYLIEAGTEDVTRIEFTFRAGYVKEHMPMLASSTNAMLTEGSQNYTSGKLQEEIDYYGAFLHMSIDKDRAGLVIFTVNRHLEKILELSHEILFRPVFPETELNALLKKRLQWLRINREKVQNLAYDQFFESIFGKHHPYGRQLTEEDFDRISPALLSDFHRKYYTPENMAIIISGKIPVETKALLNKHFGNIEPGILKEDQAAGEIRSEKQKSRFIEKKGAVQSAIRIGSSTINKRHPDYHGLKVMDSVLGGYFGSRLMRNIREDKGYTYGIRSSVASLDLSGYKVIATEVGNENVQKAIQEIYREIKILQEEMVEPVELDTVRNYMAGEMLRMFDGPFAVAESFKSAWDFGLDNSYYYRFAEKIKTITPDEIKWLAATYYNIDDLYEVIAGSK